MGMGCSWVQGVLHPDPSRQGRPGTHRMGQGFPDEKGTRRGQDILAASLTAPGRVCQPCRAAPTVAPTSTPTRTGSASRPSSSSPGNPASPRWHVLQPSRRTGSFPGALGCCWKGCRPPRHAVQPQASPATPAQGWVPSECLGPCRPPGDIGVEGHLPGQCPPAVPPTRGPQRACIPQGRLLEDGALGAETMTQGHTATSGATLSRSPTGKPPCSPAPRRPGKG